MLLEHFGWRFVRAVIRCRFRGIVILSYLRADEEEIERREEREAEGPEGAERYTPDKYGKKYESTIMQVLRMRHPGDPNGYRRILRLKNLFNHEAHRSARSYSAYLRSIVSGKTGGDSDLQEVLAYHLLDAVRLDITELDPLHSWFVATPTRPWVRCSIMAVAQYAKVMWLQIACAEFVKCNA